MKVENGGTPDRKIPEYWEPSVIPWLTSGEVKRRIIISTESSISQAGYENSSAKLWAPGTTVIALYGATAGQVCFLATETTANQACCGLIPLPSWESFVFAQASFLSTRFASLSRGSAQQNLSQGIVSDLKIVLPDEPVILAFDALVTPIRKKWINAIRQNAVLAEILESLTHKLVSGQISSTEADQLVGVVI